MVLTLDQKTSLWNKVLGKVKIKITDRHLFDSFLSDTKIYKIDGNKMIISTGSKLSCQFLNSNDHYLQTISSCVKDATETEYEISFISKDDIKELNKKSPIFETKSPCFSNLHTILEYLIVTGNFEYITSELLKSIFVKYIKSATASFAEILP